MKQIINYIFILLILIQLISNINCLNENLFKNQRQIKKSNLNNNNNFNIPLYFSILPFAKGNFSCTFGGLYGIGFTGLVNQCVNDPYNSNYNYLIYLQDEGTNNENIIYQLHNKTDTDCTGTPPWSNHHYANRVGTCDATSDFIGLEDQIVDLYNAQNGQSYLYDQPAYIVVGDIPYTAGNSVFFTLYNNSECGSQSQWPTFAKSFTQGLQLKTSDGLTYFYSCDPNTDLPQITTCKSPNNCETQPLDNNCTPVEGTDNVYQQVTCQQHFQ